MARIPLGIETDNPGSYQTKLNNREKKLAEAIREDANIEDTFQQAFTVGHTNQVDGTVYTGAAAERLGFNTGSNPFELYVSGVATGAAVVGPWQDASGLNFTSSAGGTGPDDWEIGHGTTSQSKAAYTVGSFGGNKRAFFECTVDVTDISDVTEMWMGWRKAEAYQADPDNYDEMASFNVGEDADGQIELHTILNGGATGNVDTTETDWADGAAYKLRIEVENNGKCHFFISAADTTHAGAAALDANTPTVTTDFSFDAGEVILPFLRFHTETGDPVATVNNWKVGYK